MNLDIEGLPNGIKTRRSSAHDIYPGERDRTRFNPSNTRFVSAIEIQEGPMSAYFGTLIWGERSRGKWRRTGRLRSIRVVCNGPFAKWISDDCFVTRVIGGDGTFLCLSIDANKGFRLSHKRASLDDVLSLPPDADWVTSQRKLAATIKERQSP